MRNFGFQFWLVWILGFVGSFVLSAIFWTWVLTLLFGKLQGAELTFCWAVSVFGSWFLLVIPFMRKKEQIWGRLNQDQEKAVDAWLIAMGIFIGLLIASSLFWSWQLRERIHLSTGFDPLWSKAIFSSWLFLVIPFLIFMYHQTERLFKTALLRQMPHEPQFKRLYVERAKRLLPDNISEKLKTIPFTLRGGHVITAIFRDGRRIPHVFVLDCREIIGIYERAGLNFDPQELMDIEVIAPERLPPYEESKWIRLDE